MTSPPMAGVVAEGLFENGDDGPRLIGSRCADCGTRYFPQSLSCRNPDCRDKRVERAALPDRGTLHSYTVQHYRPPALFRMDDWSPYAIGAVDLGGGLQVMGMLTGISLDRIEIGMPMRLMLEPLYANEDGQAVFTYKFAPDGEPSTAR